MGNRRKTKDTCNKGQLNSRPKLNYSKFDNYKRNENWSVEF